MTMIADGYLAIFTSHTYRKLVNKTMMIDKNQVARTLLRDLAIMAITGYGYLDTTHKHGYEMR